MSNERKKNLFTEVPAARVRRNLFDLSHEVKMSGKFGYLYPVLCVECLPGESFRDTMNIMMRFAPMLAPVMHRCDVTTHFFKVPCRLLADDWEDFITGGQDGTVAPVLPYITPAGVQANYASTVHMEKGSLWDYLGLPVWESGSFASTEQISVLPFRAVGKVWNDFYRDPNLQNEIDLNTDVAGDVSALTNPLIELGIYRRMFEKDYFTSALPFAQRGAEVLMPLSGEVTYKTASEIYNFDGSDPALGNLQTLDPGGAAPFLLADSGGISSRVENIESVENASTTINDFRRALAIQKWLEANARGGARYTEQIQSHFDEIVPDYRLQRAQYLGGGRQPVQISEVLSTAETTTADVGEMAGHGLSVGRTNQWSYKCSEHGFIVGFISVTFRTAYFQGLPRMWSRKDKFDYAWPELAHLGEQEILSKEVFLSFDSAPSNQDVFGYIPRYAEYKFHNDRVAGDFRDNLLYWHLGRKFTARPVLDVGFTTMVEPDDGGNEETFRRIFAVQDGTDYLWMQLYHRLTAKRPLPYFGVPSI